MKDVYFGSISSKYLLTDKKAPNHPRAAENSATLHSTRRQSLRAAVMAGSGACTRGAADEKRGITAGSRRKRVLLPRDAAAASGCFDARGSAEQEVARVQLRWRGEALNEDVVPRSAVENVQSAAANLIRRPRQGTNNRFRND